MVNVGLTISYHIAGISTAILQVFLMLNLDLCVMCVQQGGVRTKVALYPTIWGPYLFKEGPSMVIDCL